MSHDTEAAYASSEVADLIMINQNSYFGTMGTSIFKSLCGFEYGLKGTIERRRTM